MIIRDASYQNVVDSPELLIAELIDGDMYAWPRPAGVHVETLSVLGMIIGSAADRELRQRPRRRTGFLSPGAFGAATHRL